MPEPGTSAPEHAPLANGTCARVKRVLVCLDEGDRRGGGGMGPVYWRGKVPHDSNRRLDAKHYFLYFIVPSFSIHYIQFKNHLLLYSKSLY